MNLRRIFANAIARRVAYVVVAIALAWMGVGDAWAQSGAPAYTCSSRSGPCNRQQAYDECKAHAAYNTNQFGPGYCTAGNDVQRSVQCRRLINSSGGNQSCSPNYIFYWTEQECPAGQAWFPETEECLGNSCSVGDPFLKSGFTLALGNGTGACPTATCNLNPQGDWCKHTGTASFAMTVDGKKYCSTAGFAPTGQPCSENSPDPDAPGHVEPPVDSDGDGTSDEYDLSPNNPGESGDGSGQDVSRACGGLGQPECLPDGSNAGSGRGNTSGGGGDCNTPPRSSGDAILAQIAFQTWATRCAIKRSANAGAGTGSGSGDGGEGVLDQLRAAAAGLDQSLGDGDAEAAWIEGPTTLDLDTGGLGIGGTCPAPPTVNGVSIDPDGNLCMLVQIIGALVLVGAYVHAGYIIGRA